MRFDYTPYLLDFRRDRYPDRYHERYSTQVKLKKQTRDYFIKNGTLPKSCMEIIFDNIYLKLEICKKLKLVSVELSQILTFEALKKAFLFFAKSNLSSHDKSNLSSHDKSNLFQ